jgi:hypothetical protein
MAPKIGYKIVVRRALDGEKLAMIAMHKDTSIKKLKERTCGMATNAFAQFGYPVIARLSRWSQMVRESHSGFQRHVDYYDVWYYAVVQADGTLHQSSRKLADAETFAKEPEWAIVYNLVTEYGDHESFVPGL